MSNASLYVNGIAAQSKPASVVAHKLLTLHAGCSGTEPDEVERQT
jgi:hypothetical protein